MFGRASWQRTLVKVLLLAVAALAGIGAGPASAAWLGASELAPANAPNRPVGIPSIAMARDGTAFATFQRFDGSNPRVAVVMRNPGGGFGAVRDLSPAGQDGFNPVVAVDRQGNATIAWMQGPDFVIRARFRPAGGDWGPVSDPLSGPVINGPSVAVGDNGAAIVAWGQRVSGSIIQVGANVRPAAGQPFGGALPVSPDTGTGLCGPLRVAMDAAGNAAAIWTRRTGTGGDYYVESAVKAAGAQAWQPPQTRSSTAGNSICNTDIHMTPGGRVTAMWDFMEGASPSYVAYVDRTAPFASGAWTDSVKVSAPTVASRQPLFALDDSGNAGAIWLSGGQIVSAVRTGIGGFSPPLPLSGATALSGQAVAASPNGDAIAVFIGTSNGNDAVFSARRRAATEFRDVTPVAATPPGGATVFFNAPAIALDDEGNAFAVWQAHVSGPETYSAQVAGFDPVPPAITAADVPAAGTAGQTVAMSAAATDRMSSPSLHVDFGDGSGADGSSVQHIYGAAGAYTVTVTATDDAGNRSTLTRTIQIAPAPAPAPEPQPGPSPAVSTTTAGPTGTAAPRRVLATTAASWDRLRNGRTRLKKLVVEGLTGPETVRLTCTSKARGCRKAANVTIRKHGTKLDLSKFVKGMTLRPKAKLTITVTQPGFEARIFSYTMVSHRDPKKATRCLAPGSKKSATC